MVDFVMLSTGQTYMTGRHMSVRIQSSVCALVTARDPLSFFELLRVPVQRPAST